MVEVERGVERPDWTELIAPLRQAGRTLGSAGELLRQLDDEATLRTWIKALNELPPSITFHPFATTGNWSVNLEREQPVASRTAQLQSWSPALTSRARQRQQFSVVDSAAAHPSSTTRSRRAAKTDSALADALSPGTRSDAQAAARLMPQTGAWSALLAIVHLVDEIESAPQSGRSPSATPAPVVLPPQQGRKARGVGTASGTKAAATDAPAARWDTGELVVASATSAANSESEHATALLARYVAALWSSAEAPASSQSMTVREASRNAVEPAAAARPRAPSLLLPATAPLETPPGPDSEARAAGGISPSTAWPENDPGDRDALADRLNRELLEQAWLRGVDLT